jgi:hypothetical protein
VTGVVNNITFYIIFNLYYIVTLKVRKCFEFYKKGKVFIGFYFSINLISFSTTNNLSKIINSQYKFNFFFTIKYCLTHIDMCHKSLLRTPECRARH